MEDNETDNQEAEVKELKVFREGLDSAPDDRPRDEIARDAIPGRATLVTVAANAKTDSKALGKTARGGATASPLGPSLYCPGAVAVVPKKREDDDGGNVSRLGAVPAVNTGARKKWDLATAGKTTERGREQTCKAGTDKPEAATDAAREARWLKMRARRRRVSDSVGDAMRRGREHTEEPIEAPLLSDDYLVSARLVVEEEEEEEHAQDSAGDAMRRGTEQTQEQIETPPLSDDFLVSAKLVQDSRREEIPSEELPIAIARKDNILETLKNNRALRWGLVVGALAVAAAVAASIVVAVRRSPSGEDTNNSAQPSSSREFTKRCGDCWCIPNIESQECPAFDEGYSETFPSVIIELYGSFTQRPSPNDPKLESADGDPCFPFADFPEHPLSERPCCELPFMWNSTEAVCAYLFPTTVSDIFSCHGREYEMRTFESWAAAEAAGADITHKGACGVCSNAHDLAIYMKDILSMTTYKCREAFLVGYTKSPKEAFLSAVGCYKDTGLTHPCAEIWAYGSTAVMLTCKDEIDEDKRTNATVVGPPPGCQYSKEWMCILTGSQYRESTMFGGRTLPNSGIIFGRLPFPCDAITSVIHRPCGDIEYRGVS